MGGINFKWKGKSFKCVGPNEKYEAGFQNEANKFQSDELK